MIVDSSAIIAIAFEEPEAERLAVAIARTPVCHICSVNWLETMMVIESRAGTDAADDTLLILGQLGISILPFDAAYMHEAQEAWRRYGIGRHPAALNLGDCCAYAASRIEGRPLLFKGDDFGKTDVEKAIW
jgi:ribonuclease VapC